MRIRWFKTLGIAACLAAAGCSGALPVDDGAFPADASREDVDGGNGGACAAGETRACYSGPAGTDGVGRCRAGAQACGPAGEWSGACEGEATPAAEEACGNGEDDDCDGMTDEGCCPAVDLGSRLGRRVASGSLSGAQSASMGSCGGRGREVAFGWTAPSSGSFTFDTAGSSYDTVLYVRRENCDGGEVACNDDAARGTLASAITVNLTAGDRVVIFVDAFDAEEGNFVLGVNRSVPTECAPGATRACYTGPAGSAVVGRCRAGTQTCDASGRWASACAGEVTPASAETCGNGADDDCDGMTDEGCGVCAPGATRACYAGPAGTDGVGLCRAGVQRCDTSGNWSAACLGEVGPAAEVCGNGADDDCDGMTDEGCGVCTPGATRACYSGPAATRGVGRCQAGMQTCDATGNWPATCGGEVTPAAADACGNGVDDDCNGTTDDACGGAASDVALGGHHSCALRADRTVWCWGKNSSGQLGDGTTAQRTAPTRVPGLGDVTQLALGTFHSCALLADRTVRCWGDNFFGQLGDGTSTDRHAPVAVAGLSNVAQIAAGGSTTCALATDGTVRCWGQNSYGQLGDGTTTSRRTPGLVPGLAGVAQVDVGLHHACARLPSGAARCWGRNANGQLGDGTTTDRASPVAVPGLASVAELALGGDHSCARLSDGTARCWGGNAYGQLGDGSITQRTSPVPVAGLASVAELALGDDHSCARLTDGTLRCWGQNEAGEIGIGTRGSTETRRTPTLVAGVTGATRIAAGGYILANHTCALLAGGALRCWGDDRDGQLGVGGYGRVLAPVALPGLASGATQIDMGGDHGCARMSDGRVRCWGNNRDGRLGDGTTEMRAAPTLVPGLSGVAQVALGFNHSCARLSDGTARCWGNNLSGQLGDGTTSERTSPAVVTGLSSVVQIAAGTHFTCAVRTGGAVVCWGGNHAGQLGDGTTTSRRTPTAVSGLSSGIAEVALGATHACARTTTGAVRCWGRNASGQLGDGTTTDRHTPVTVPGLSGVAQIAAAGAYTCARIVDGTVRCWGENSGAQLGDGTTTDRRSPTVVVGVTTAAGIAAGSASTTGATCAWLADGTARCWGYNGSGQLGDGTTTTRRTPTAVPGLSGLAQVSTNGLSSCARSSAGGLHCWGENYLGQLGLGTAGHRTLPTAVLWP